MLIVNFDTFWWHRPQTKQDHFRWSDGQDPILLAGGRGYQTYAPKQHPALFRAFGTLGADRAQILGFANKFGLLVGPSQDDIEKRGFKLGEDWPMSAADMGCYRPSTFRLSDWVTRIEEMKKLIDLVELMTNDMDHPQPQRRVADPVKNRSDFLRALSWQPPDATAAIHLEDPQTADALAELAVGKIIDKYKTVVLTSATKVAWDGRNRRPTLSIIPVDLGHFLYWQLCESFFTGAAFRQCEVCGKWERPERPDCWSTCSLACRSKKCRSAKKKPASKRRPKAAAALVSATSTGRQRK